MLFATKVYFFLSIIFFYHERNFLSLKNLLISILQTKKPFMHIDIIVLRVYIRHFTNDIEVKVQSQLLTVKWLTPIEFYIYSTSSP